METWVVLYIASFVIFLFISFSLFFRLDCPLWLKLAGCFLLLVGGSKFLIYQFFGGAFFAPQLPRPVLLCLEAAYGAFFILFFLLLLWDLYLCGNWLLAKAGIPVPRHLPTGIIRASLAALAIAVGIWGTWQAVKVPEPRVVHVPVASLPKALSGFSIVQLTDIHIGPILKKDWLQEVVNRTNALSPDLILMTGDYVDGYAGQMASELEPLAGLKARYGVFAVTGNHEYYWSMPEWRKALENLDITFLENDHRTLDINGATIVLAGIPDLAATKFGFSGPDLSQALANAPEAFRILLSHQPKYARDYAGKIDLVLSGHTHGGLIFFLQPLIAHFNSGFVRGMYPLSGINVYVSPGTGLWNGFSCRIGVPSEITKLILEAAP